MAQVRRGYVEAGGRAVHYRTCGAGPAVVMLHDSPRSSRLHLPTMAALADRFTLFALDTPGYGNSAPLALPGPTIPDFAEALGQALAALGLEQAPVYATHTSAKIALALAARGGLMPQLVLDGLSIPEQLAAPEFLAAYMRPFQIDDAGAYLAAEWSRTRDMLRWFPWFTPTPPARVAMAAPTPEWMADYGVDLFCAGPHYADAYAAAMRWDPTPDLLAVRVPTLVAARTDDVLYPHLDRVPATENPALAIRRLGPDRTEWLDWLANTLTQRSSPFSRSANGEVAGAPRRLTKGQRHNATGYLDLPHGQLHWHRLYPASPPLPQAGGTLASPLPQAARTLASPLPQAGGAGGGQGATARPSPTILVLSAPTTLQARAWAEALGPTHSAIFPDLPGFGDSDPLPAPDADALADALAALVQAEAAGRAAVLGIGLAAPLAARLAARHPELVTRLVVDGAPPLDPAAAGRFGAGLCPEIAFDPHAGTHLHRIWHILRDGEVQWPWHDSGQAAARRLPPLLAGAGLHAALTGVLRQPRDWGQAARAALAAGTLADWSRVAVPTTVFAHADPAHAEAEAIAAAVPGAEVLARPDTLDEAARALSSKEG